MEPFLTIKTSEPHSPNPKEVPILLSDSAVLKIKALSVLNPGREHLRLYVESGGCSGYSYGFKFDTKKSTDLEFERDGATCITDPKSYLLIAGSTLDYIDALTGAGFTIKNPQAAHTCGCGSSFGL